MSSSAVRVVLVPLPFRVPGGLPAWQVLLDGRTIIPRSHDPEHEAARWLRDRGYVGPMETAREDGMVCMRYPDLVETAEWSIADRPSGGFRRERYRSMSAGMPTAAPAGRAGRPQTPSLAPDTLPAIVAVHDDTAA